MPTPDRTSLDEIIRAGRDLLESKGLAGMTMQAVAERVGVRAPSLYKRLRDRDDLIRLITEATLHDLGHRLNNAAHGVDAAEDLGTLARAFRAFAHERPASYHLIFAPGSQAARPDPESIARASAPVLEVAARLAGPENALEGARMITAWANGFLGMELAGAFNLGGDVDRAYEFGIARLAEALGNAAAGSTPANRSHPRAGASARALVNQSKPSGPRRTP
jgi:AcrR family transcriptional regulator